MSEKLAAARQQAIETLSRLIRKNVAESQEREFLISEARPDDDDPSPDENGIPQRWIVETTLRVGGALMSCPYTIDLREDNIGG